MKLTAFFHIWAGGAWRQPLEEFKSALRESDFHGPVYYCATGEPDESEWLLHGVILSSWARSGFEANTLNHLRHHAERHEGAVLYAHTKGAADTSEFRARWRRSMTNRVVRDWRSNLALLKTGDYDVVGCHWLTQEVFGRDMFGPTLPPEGSGFYGGNFWMATCDYIRRLPPCPDEPRFEAERWIGLDCPRAVDLLPGWPGDERWPELCT